MKTRTLVDICRNRLLRHYVSTTHVRLPAGVLAERLAVYDVRACTAMADSRREIQIPSGGLDTAHQ